ncbi:MAG: hypothetical protein IJ604_13370 [Prevotella sp.]|nr:hypothetical protein [Prevotella sp.]MBR1464348.1 hypothetical protein [Prevotella sp.]
MKKLLYILFLMGVLYSCDQEESVFFDEPFVRISTSTGEARTVVLSNVRNTNAYSVYVSSRPITDSLEVSYEIIVGDGLQEDVDYKIVTTANPLVFLPGINDMPIRIRWLQHAVNPEKDNTVTIRLTGNSKGFNLGFPGPDHVQSQVVIEKRNN